MDTTKLTNSKILTKELMTKASERTKKKNAFKYDPLIWISE